MATLKEDGMVIAGVAIAVLVIAWYAKKKADDAANELAKLANDAWDATKKALDKVNPVSTNNLAYQGASGLTRWLTGQEDGTLGTILWDYTNKAAPSPDGVGLINYTPAQQAADAEATRRLEAGYHGM